MDDEAKRILLAVGVGALFMLACLYGVFFQGWSKHIVTFVSPLGVAVPCALHMWSVSRREAEAGKARIRALALGALTGYVGGQILIAICVLAWNLVG